MKGRPPAKNGAPTFDPGDPAGGCGADEPELVTGPVATRSPTGTTAVARDRPQRSRSSGEGTTAERA